MSAGIIWKTEKEKSHKSGSTRKIKRVSTHFYTNVDQVLSSEEGMPKGSGWLKVLRMREKITINSLSSKRELENWGEAKYFEWNGMP
jgi:hypothetical protein